MMVTAIMFTVCVLLAAVAVVGLLARLDFLGWPNGRRRR